MKKNRVIKVQVNMYNYANDILTVVFTRIHGTDAISNVYHVNIDSKVVGMLEKVPYNHPDNIRTTVLLRYVSSIHMAVVKKMPIAW